MKKVMLFILIGIAEALAIGMLIWNIFKKNIKRNNETREKILNYYYILNQWLSKKQKEKSLLEFFEFNKYKKIAIYGRKELGERLYDELVNTNIEVECFIDQNYNNIKSNIPVISPEQSIPKVDAIVVTASDYFSEIRAQLKQKAVCDIVSIEDVVYFEI